MQRDDVPFLVMAVSNPHRSMNYSDTEWLIDMHSDYPGMWFDQTNMSFSAMRLFHDIWTYSYDAI